MTSGKSGAADFVLSVVIPSYNSAEWLPTTFDALATAVRQAGATVEVILVDDGSTDDTRDVIGAIAPRFPGAIELIQQENQGRFLARWAGIERARSELVLLLDSRVLLAADSLEYVLDQIATSRDRRIWNAHVFTDPRTPLVGLFWDVPTHAFWGHYLRSPGPTDITAANFDSVPKGTTAFLAPAAVLRAAFEQAWPAGDARLMSDDTKILRWIAETSTIRLDPGFSATYRPRTTLRGFISHSFIRGTLFVDSYAGTSALRSAILLGLGLAPLLLLGLVIVLSFNGYSWAAVGAVGLFLLLALALMVPAAINRCPPRSLLAFVCCLPVFSIPFWLGLVRGLVVHRGAFTRRRPSPATVRKESV